MAQPGEARPAAHAQVATIQKWIVGVAIGCAVIGFIAFFVAQLQVHQWQQPEPRPASLTILYSIEELFLALGCLVAYVGRGLLMYLRPHDVQGQLRQAAERTGLPRLYGLVMIWCPVALVSAWGLMVLQAYQASLLDNSAVSAAIFGLALASILPLLLLEAYGWWRHIQHRMAE